MTKRYSGYLSPLVYILDLIMLNTALVISHLLMVGIYRLTVLEMNFVLLANMSWSIISALTKSYKTTRPNKLRTISGRFLRAFIYNLLLFLFLIRVFNLADVNPVELTAEFSLFAIMAICARVLLFYTLNVLRKQGFNKQRVIVIGDTQISDRLKNSFEKHPEYGYDIVSYIPADDFKSVPVENLDEVLLAFDPREIFLCYTQIDNALLRNLIAFGEANFVKIKLISDLYLENKFAQLVIYDNLPTLAISPHDQMDAYIDFYKRSFDILFSSAVMVLGFPVFCSLYVITRLSSEGPAFYRQERIGKDGIPFYIYKFRSMRANSEVAGPQLSRDNDPRITRWGKIIRKTRLDELPQFYNVLKGEMSIVGPRPERQHFIEKIIERRPHYRNLLKIRPGLTSMGQVNYGYAENVDQLCDRVQFDLPYLKNMSINSDLSIIAKTVKVMVQLKGK